MSDSSGGLVEKVAQAVYEAGGVTRPKKVWDDLGVSTRRLYAAMAAAAVQVVQDQRAGLPNMDNYQEDMLKMIGTISELRAEAARLKAERAA